MCYFVWDVNIFRLYFIMKYVFIGILCDILVILKAGYPAAAAVCGELEFEQSTLTEGDSATLIYTPKNVHASRLWIKEGPPHIVLYDSRNASHNLTYTELREGDKYTLSFKTVEKADAGKYFVLCGGADISNRITLTVESSAAQGCGMLRVQTQEGDILKLVFKISPSRDIQWEKKINSTFKQLVMNGKYHTIANGFKTVHYLWIYQSKYSDSGEYRVNCGPAVSNTVHLNIAPTAPSVPEFSDALNIYDCEKCIPAQLNVKVAVECFVTGGSEPIDLNIFKNGKFVPNVTRRNSAKSTFVRHEYVPTRADFDLTFTCTVKNPLTTEKGKSAVLYIQVQPKTVVLKKVNSVTENQSSDIECITTEGRPPVKSEIYFGGYKANNTETKVVRTGHTYTVTTTTTRLFNRVDNQLTILCCSPILNRSCSHKEPLNVKFPPRKVSITELKKDNKDNGDTEVTLKCSVEESNPKSSIEWKGIKNVQRIQADTGAKYHNSTRGWTFSATWMLNLTKIDNYRNIRCVVRNQAFPDLELEHSYRPNITYSPVMTISGHENQISYIGDNVLLACHVDSNPPSTLRWHNQYDIIKEKTPQKARGESSSASIVGPIVGCSILAIVVLVAIIVFVAIRKKRHIVQPQTKRTDDLQLGEIKSNANRGRTDTLNGNEGTSKEEENFNEQREYAYIGTENEGEGTHVYSEPTNDYVNETLSITAAGAKFVRTNLDLKQDVKKVLKVQGEQTNDSVYVNSMQPEYESLMGTSRKETDTYSKLGFVFNRLPFCTIIKTIASVSDGKYRIHDQLMLLQA